MHGTRERTPFPQKAVRMALWQVPCASLLRRSPGEWVSRVLSPCPGPPGWGQSQQCLRLLSSLIELKAAPSPTLSREPGEGNSMGTPRSRMFSAAGTSGWAMFSSNNKAAFYITRICSRTNSGDHHSHWESSPDVLHPIAWPYWRGPQASVLRVTESCSPDPPPTIMSKPGRGGAVREHPSSFPFVSVARTCPLLDNLWHRAHWMCGKVMRACLP